MINYFKNQIAAIKLHLKEHSFDNLIWICNIAPKFAGFSLKKDKVSAPFWVVHCSLLFYVYAVGCFAYQWKFAQGAEDFIKSYFNVSLFILIGNISFWWIKKRPILRKTLIQIEINDKLARESVFRDKYKGHISVIRNIIIAFYASQVIDAVFIYLPHRIDVTNNYSMVPCVGLEPLTSSPNKEICLVILCVEELSIMATCLDYQALLLCLIAHTASMYHMLTYEMMALNKKENQAEDPKIIAKEKLPTLIYRHIIILDVFNKLKALYSIPIGIDFGSNAICISLFFYLSFQEWLAFSPVLIYCILVFFLYCFLCQKLTNAAEEFEKAVYACGWENFDLKEQKLVFIMLWQAQKPIVLYAGDIIPVNVYTFATTLQNMFKFVTVVKL